MKSHADLSTTSPAENSTRGRDVCLQEFRPDCASATLSASRSPENPQMAGMERGGQSRGGLSAYTGVSGSDSGRMKIGILVPHAGLLLCSEQSVLYTSCHLIFTVTQWRK